MEDDSDRHADGAPASNGMADRDSKPRIVVAPGENHLATEAAELILAGTGRYFTSGGVLSRVNDRGGHGVAVEHVHEQTLKAELAARIDWYRPSQSGISVRCDPPHGVIQALMYGQDRHHLKPLLGVARQPFYSSDGRLVASPGYDADTAIYASFAASDYRLDNPSEELAEYSLRYLESLVDETEFETEHDRSAAVCAMLTAAIRPSLPLAPAFNITATGSGSGKSYLADIITAFAGPEEPHRVTFPTRSDEASKLIVTVLMSRPNVIIFDDMDSDWKSLGPLNRALTSATTTERLLGSNRSITVPTNVLWLGTGNNIEPKMDLRRRVVSIRLAPKTGTPALRAFQSDPVADLRTKRARAVECALNIIGAFLASGASAPDVRSISNYDWWSRFCRYPLIWLGRPDPAQSLIDQVSHDPDLEALADFLEVWHNTCGSRSLTVRKLLEKAQDHPPLLEALEELPVVEGRVINRGKLGWFLGKNRGRRVSGYRIERGDSSERRAWTVVVG